MRLVVLVYAMLFMEWDERGSPFDEVRVFLAKIIQIQITTDAVADSENLLYGRQRRLLYSPAAPTCR